jgi:hypothetical protein
VALYFGIPRHFPLKLTAVLSIPLPPTAILNNNNQHYIVYFAIKDGGEFDLDGEVNGEIVDPNILVLPDSPPSGGGNTPGSGSGGGSGGGEIPSDDGSTPGGGDDSDEEPRPVEPVPGIDPAPVSTVPSGDGKVHVSLPVHVPEGKTVTKVQIDEDSSGLERLEEIGLTATVDALNNVVIDGMATDIGTFVIPVTITLSDGSLLTESVTVTVEAVENITETAVDLSETKRTITSTLSTNSDNSVSVVLTCPLDIGANNPSAVKDLAVQASDMTIENAALSTSLASSVVNIRGVGSPILTAAGRTTAIDSAKITGVTYRFGVNRYTQKLDLSIVRDTNVVDNRTTPEKPGDETDNVTGNSGGGCSEGLPVWAILLAFLGVVRKLRVR